MKNKYCPFSKTRHEFMEKKEHRSCRICEALNRQREDMEKEILDRLGYVFIHIEPKHYISCLREKDKISDTDIEYHVEYHESNLMKLLR